MLKWHMLSPSASFHASLVVSFLCSSHQSLISSVILWFCTSLPDSPPPLPARSGMTPLTDPGLYMAVPWFLDPRLCDASGWRMVGFGAAPSTAVSVNCVALLLPVTVIPLMLFLRDSAAHALHVLFISVLSLCLSLSVSVRSVWRSERGMLSSLFPQVSGSSVIRICTIHRMPLLAPGCSRVQ